jgi:hypothetical protein
MISHSSICLPSFSFPPFLSLSLKSQCNPHDQSPCIPTCLSVPSFCLILRILVRLMLLAPTPCTTCPAIMHVLPHASCLIPPPLGHMPHPYYNNYPCPICSSTLHHFSSALNDARISRLEGLIANPSSHGRHSQNSNRSLSGLRHTSRHCRSSFLIRDHPSH